MTTMPSELKKVSSEASIIKKEIDDDTRYQLKLKAYKYWDAYIDPMLNDAASEGQYSCSVTLPHNLDFPLREVADDYGFVVRCTNLYKENKELISEEIIEISWFKG
jgi:hypothetical protein